MQPSSSPAGALLEVDLGPGARGCFTTRGPGGAGVPSEGAFAGWNLAVHVGDDASRVACHRRQLERLLGVGAEGGEPAGTEGAGLAWMTQIHSAQVAEASGANEPVADALVLDTRRPGAPAGACVLVADCVPLLLASTDGRLLAAVHAGRKGMLAGVVTATVDALVAAGADPSQLWAATGPRICGTCYEVSGPMREESAQREPACASTTRWGTPGLDVAAGVVAQLERSGIRRIAVGPWCTFEDQRFFSYRRDGVTGRLAGVVLARRP